MRPPRQPTSAFMLAAILSVTPVTGLAQDSHTEDRVLDCRQKTDNAARLACYDGIADQLASSTARNDDTDSTTPAPPPGAGAAAAGAASTSASVEEDDASGTLAVTVVDCRRLYDDDYLFTLSNGEYWRQTGGATLRLRECRFDATISRNFFGYRMTIGDSGETVHVKRVQ